MVQNAFSNQLQDYLDKVKSKTNRDILIEYTERFSLPGMKAAFRMHPTHIHIMLLKGLTPSMSGTEQSIAHEATHGLLIFGKGYFYPHSLRQLTPLENNSSNLIGTMIDDIVVARTIQDEGFSPYAPNYLQMTQDETKAANKGRDIYSQLKSGPEFRTRFMIYRYVAAWGCIRYHTLTTRERKIFRRFTKAFRSSYPNEYKIASKIIESIEQNDIFTQEGHKKVFTLVMNLWRLEEAVELITS